MKCGCIYKLTVNNCLLSVHSNITIGHLSSIISAAAASRFSGVRLCATP